MEKGTNKNTNELLRQYFPKKYDFSLISEAINNINSRPRKVLGYLTAQEVFGMKLIVALNLTIQEE